MLNFPNFDPVAFTVGPMSVRWYGIMYFVGFFLAWRLGRFRIKRADKHHAPFTAQQFDDVLIWGVFGVIVGARLGYVLFYNLSLYIAKPLEIFALWNGGMSFHGGLIGVAIAIWLAGKKYKSSFFSTCDFIVPLVPPGLFFGRLGNFINGELPGRVTDVAWAMVFPHGDTQPRHPSQLYEAFLEGLVLFIIMWIFSNKKRKKGAVSGLFLICYGAFRFIVEMFREPDIQLGFLAGNFLTMGMLLCLPMILFGLYLLFRYNPTDDLVETSSEVRASGKSNIKNSSAPKKSTKNKRR